MNKDKNSKHFLQNRYPLMEEGGLPYVFIGERRYPVKSQKIFDEPGKKVRTQALLKKIKTVIIISPVPACIARHCFRRLKYRCTRQAPGADPLYDRFLPESESPVK